MCSVRNLNHYPFASCPNRDIEVLRGGYDLALDQRTPYLADQRLCVALLCFGERVLVVIAQSGKLACASLPRWVEEGTVGSDSYGIG